MPGSIYVWLYGEKCDQTTPLWQQTSSLVVPMAKSGAHSHRRTLPAAARKLRRGTVLSWPLCEASSADYHPDYGQVFGYNPSKEALRALHREILLATGGQEYSRKNLSNWFSRHRAT